MHRLFLVSVWIKGIAGLIETLAGLLCVALGANVLNAVAVRLSAPELTDDRAVSIAANLSREIQTLSPDTRRFVGFYLLSHGLVKLCLVAGILRGKSWAFPAALWVLGAFVAYQSYRYVQTQSVALALLTGFDLFVVLMIWREYRSRAAASS